MKKFLVAALVVVMALPSMAQLAKSHGSDDFKIGIAGYNFRKQNTEDALKFMQGLGVKYLSVKDFQLPMTATAEDVANFKALMAKYDVEGYTLGPIYMKDSAAVDKTFEYVKLYGSPMFIGVPNYELIPYVEQKVKEYDIRLAIHNHGPDPQDFHDADDIMEYIGNRDARLGICMDIGHTVRYGKDCIEQIKKYKDRIFDIHIKDETAASKAGKTVEMGRGVMDIPGIVKALRKAGYTGMCSLEYEPTPDNPFPAISESIGYFRGVCDATK